MDENAPLVLQGLRQMTQAELNAIASACAQAQARARQALAPRNSQLKIAARQALDETELQPEDFTEANWPATLQRIGRRVAWRAREATQQAALELQRQLFEQLAGTTAGLYSFGVAFDQLSQVALAPGRPLNDGQSLLQQLHALWRRQGGSGEPLDAPTLAGTTGQLAGRLALPQLEQRLLDLHWPAGPRPTDAAHLRHALSARLDEIIEQALREQQTVLELALDNHVRLIFNALALTLDQCFAARRRILEDHATRPGDKGAASPA